MESYVSTMNCRFLISKFGMLEEYLLDLHHKFHITTITATWLESSNDLSFFQLDGSDMYHVDRGKKNDGGVAIYIQNSQCVAIIRGNALAITASPRTYAQELVE